MSSSPMGRCNCRSALQPSIKGQITKLGIVAHGDEAGVVEIGPKLTVDTAASIALTCSSSTVFWPPTRVSSSSAASPEKASGVTRS
jgi:hypothetical protein